ncbi:hypothetical protein D6745_03390 [Candidatus Woesearchaeota archaeon]|nr:MAG: hypothetical protein D6745_03390 [Candidatus Woesearchaeota archaeon]
MRIELNFEKKHFYILVVLIVLLFGAGFVVGVGSNLARNSANKEPQHFTKAPAPEVPRSVPLSTGLIAQESIPNPGHNWSEILLPTGIWYGLTADDSDKLDGYHASNFVLASTYNYHDHNYYTTYFKVSCDGCSGNACNYLDWDCMDNWCSNHWGSFSYWRGDALCWGPDHWWCIWNCAYMDWTWGIH